MHIKNAVSHAVPQIFFSLPKDYWEIILLKVVELVWCKTKARGELEMPRSWNMQKHSAKFVFHSNTDAHDWAGELKPASAIAVAELF